LTVVKVAERAGREASVLEALTQLRSEGYQIAAGGFSGDPDCADLYRAADILAIDAEGKDRNSLSRSIAAAKSFKATLLADSIPGRGQHATCRELGFSLFHGEYFKSPETMTVRKLSSNEILRLKLLHEIEKDDPNLAQIAEIVQADATVSFRLLSYINSAAFAFSQKITSIRQAITLMGWTKFKSWLRVILLADMGQSKDSGELVRVSAQRGMFLELITRAHNSWNFDPELVHLLGVFSLLDALLQIPMNEIVDSLPIDEGMKAALRRETGSEYLPLLQLAQLMEETKWSEADLLSQQLKLDHGQVRKAFQTSIDWASTLESAAR
jgi:EAL and modified HD-GYP domain-containing signal transduction protein